MIFINYRVDDTNDVAARLEDHLIRNFGREQVFRDKGSIGAGAKWSDRIEKALVDSTVVLALMGPQWCSEKNRERLADPEDWVRKELAVALGSERLVVPVAVNGASLPDRNVLEGFGLDGLSAAQATPLRTNDFEEDVAQIIETIRSRGGAKTPSPGLEGVPSHVVEMIVGPKDYAAIEVFAEMFFHEIDRRKSLRFMSEQGVVDQVQSVELDEVPDAVGNSLGEIESLIQCCMRLLPAFNELMKARNDPDPDFVIALAQRFGTEYERMLQWTLRVRGLHCGHPAGQKVIDLLSGAFFPSIEMLDRTAKTMPQQIEGPIRAARARKSEGMEVEPALLTFELTFEMPRNFERDFNRALDDLKWELHPNPGPLQLIGRWLKRALES